MLNILNIEAYMITSHVMNYDCWYQCYIWIKESFIMVMVTCYSLLNLTRVIRHAM